MSNSVLERLERLPRIAALLLGLALIVAIAWLDYVTGPQLLMNVFYLLPVMLVAWVTASTAYGLLAVLVTFLVGPLEAYLDGFHLYTLPVAAWNAGMRTAVFCIVLLLLAEVRKLVARLQEQSLTDELTGVANRRAFLEVATREIERSRRYRHELSLAYLDLDGFKAVNGQRGHTVGDRVLIALAGLARATARSVDTVARIGGDEFVILMPETEPAPRCRWPSACAPPARGRPVRARYASPAVSGWSPSNALLAISRSCSRTPTRSCTRPRLREATACGMHAWVRRRRRLQRADCCHSYLGPGPKQSRAAERLTSRRELEVLLLDGPDAGRDDVGLEIRFHDLRHTHATQLLKAGVHPKVVSERLGHASSGITLDAYSHVMPSMQEEAAEKIDAGLRAALAG